ncbi:BQ5605_C027g10323 [Microbotryum silenes-dioicae]|uniref:BQ5605_C027g10323 protein n=1 Tax=Microbotryum silenes-dioicae TaxID=796604 RepID=A0A2X0PN92_9BASI|nr:BQ5605_C027g10323 [Microbotryum silenes-dioicae]
MAPRINASTGKLEVKGKVLEVNDHALVSAPWLDREGEPYLVARILEVLPPVVSSGSSTPTTQGSSSKRPASTKVSNTVPRVRVNYYLRSRDITSRYVADFRLVVATMHADVIPIAYIRHVCTVQHKEHIADMRAFKALPDAFYWSQVYDRYLHRYFDAVPVNKVQNAPPDVVKHLTTHFEFILCEPSMTNELCDAQRGCSKCSEWAASSDSVICARCAKVFHLGCVDPPLAQKPKAGWAWACAPCARAHQVEVDAYMETGIAPTRHAAIAPKPHKSNGKGSSAPDSSSKDALKNGTKLATAKGSECSAESAASAQDRGKGKEVDLGKRGPYAKSRQWRMLNGWPFRYYGMHTPSNSVLDRHDSIYPRTGTRLGHRYQITIPAWDYAKAEPEAPAPMFGAVASKPRRKVDGSTSALPKIKKKLLNMQTIRRGEDDELAGVIADPKLGIDDDLLDEVVEEVKRMILYRHAGVDALNRVLSLLVLDDKHEVATALDAMRKLTQNDLGFPPWTEADRKKLSDGVQKHLNDIEEIRKSLLPNKKMRDVVKRYYIHMGHLVQEDIPAQMDERAMAASAASPDKKKKKSSAKNGGRVASGQDSSNANDSDGESVVDAPKSVVVGKKEWTCSICDITKTPKWYLCPDTLNDDLVTPEPCVMCEECGIRWRHYGIQFAPTDTDDLAKTAPLPDGIVHNPRDFKGKKVAAPSDATTTASAAQAGPKAGAGAITGAVVPVKATVASGSHEPVWRPCLLCKRVPPMREHASCLNCGMTVHVSCYGINGLNFPNLKKWICDLCDIEEGKKESLKVRQPLCLLCPPRTVQKSKRFTALDCMKLTEFDNHIHLLCAVWHPEIKLTVPSDLGDAEGLSLIPSKRRLATCVLCKKDAVGACVKCAQCPKMFHVSCAWIKPAYRLGFEVHPIRKKKPKETPTVKFKDEEGELVAAIWCNEHSGAAAPDQVLHDISARDPATNLTAMQMHARAFKSSPDDTYMLLRRARRLDALVEPVLNPLKQNLPRVPPGTSWSRDSTLSRTSVLSKKRRTPRNIHELTLRPSFTLLSPALPESPSPKKLRLHEVSARLLDLKRNRRSSSSSEEEAHPETLEPPTAKRAKAAFASGSPEASSNGRAASTGATPVRDPPHCAFMGIDESSQEIEEEWTGSTTPTNSPPSWRFSFAGLIARLNKARRLSGLPIRAPSPQPSPTQATSPSPAQVSPKSKRPMSPSASSSTPKIKVKPSGSDFSSTSALGFAPPLPPPNRAGKLIPGPALVASSTKKRSGPEVGPSNGATRSSSSTPASKPKSQSRKSTFRIGPLPVSKERPSSKAKAPVEPKLPARKSQFTVTPSSTIKRRQARDKQTAQAQTDTTPSSVVGGRASGSGSSSSGARAGPVAEPSRSSLPIANPIASVANPQFAALSDRATPASTAENSDEAEDSEDAGTRRSKRKRVISEAARDAIEFEKALAELDRDDPAIDVTSMNGSRPAMHRLSTGGATRGARGAHRRGRGRHSDAAGTSRSAAASKQSRGADDTGAGSPRWRSGVEDKKNVEVQATSSTSSSTPSTSSVTSKTSGIVVRFSIGGKRVGDADTISPPHVEPKTSANAKVKPPLGVDQRFGDSGMSSSSVGGHVALVSNGVTVPAAPISSLPFAAAAQSNGHAGLSSISAENPAMVPKKPIITWNRAPLAQPSDTDRQALTTSLPVAAAEPRATPAVAPAEPSTVPVATKSNGGFAPPLQKPSTAGLTTASPPVRPEFRLGPGPNQAAASSLPGLPNSSATAPFPASDAFPAEVAVVNQDFITSAV